MGQTIVEKIAQAHLAEGPKRPLRTGDFVAIRPHRVMTHDNTSAVMKKFQTHRREEDSESQTAGVCPRPRHPEQGRFEPAEVPGHRRLREISRRGFLSRGFGHRPPDHGGARIRCARIVRCGLRLALQYVRRAGRRRHADRAHRCGRGLGDGRFLVADSALHPGGARRHAARGRNRQRRHHHAVRTLQPRRSPERGRRIQRTGRGQPFHGRALFHLQHDHRVGAAGGMVSGG